MSNIGRVHAEIADHCAEIAELFKPGAKITILVRNPHIGSSHSADVLVGDDTPEEAAAAILALKEMQERKLTLEDLVGG